MNLKTESFIHKLSKNRRMLFCFGKWRNLQETYIYVFMPSGTRSFSFLKWVDEANRCCRRGGWGDEPANRPALGAEPFSGRATSPVLLGADCLRYRPVCKGKRPSFVQCDHFVLTRHRGWVWRWCALSAAGGEARQRWSSQASSVGCVPPAPLLRSSAAALAISHRGYHGCHPRLIAVPPDRTSPPSGQAQLRVSRPSGPPQTGTHCIRTTAVSSHREHCSRRPHPRANTRCRKIGTLPSWSVLSRV